MEALGVVAWNSTVGSGEHCDLAGNLNLNMNEEVEEEEQGQRREPGLELKRIDELILIICNGRFTVTHCFCLKGGGLLMGLGLGKIELHSEWKNRK